jgi:hypothetical protein
MLALWFTFLGGSFVFLDAGPSILFLVFPLFGVLWFTDHWQGFIILVHSLEVKLDKFPTRESSKSC